MMMDGLPRRAVWLSVYRFRRHPQERERCHLVRAYTPPRWYISTVCQEVWIRAETAQLMNHGRALTACGRVFEVCDTVQSTKALVRGHLPTTSLCATCKTSIALRAYEREASAETRRLVEERLDRDVVRYVDHCLQAGIDLWEGRGLRAFIEAGEHL